MKTIKQLIQERRNKKLIKEFPFLQIRNVWSGEVLDEPYFSTWLDDMPDGWRNAFGLKMCQEIKDLLVKNNCLNDYRILEVKEKYGTLRWYDNGGPKGLDAIISKYEDMSMCICPYCGKPTKYYTKGWISYICEDCKNALTAEGKFETNFVRLTKEDAPCSIKFDFTENKKIKVLCDKEVQKIIDENWE